MGEVIKTKAGELTVLETWRNPRSQKICKFLCVCGKNFSCRLDNIIRGSTHSCGCYHANITSVYFYKHGHSGYDKLYKKTRRPTGIYRLWRSYGQKCNNPNRPDYPYYGGKGIKVCDEWANSFETFLKDMGDRPIGCRLNRIDKDGDFEPDNCEWVPIKGKRKKR